MQKNAGDSEAESRLIQLVSAIQSENADEVQFLINQLGGYVNHPVPNDANGRPTLHVAAQIGNIEILKLFIENKDVINDKKDCYGTTALHVAAFAGQNEALKLLLESETIDIDAGYSKDDVEFVPALDLAMENCNFDGARILIEAGAECYPRNALRFAAEFDFGTSFLEFLLSRDDNVSYLNQSLLVAAKKCESDSHLKIIKILLEKGGDVNTKDEKRNTPLHLVIQRAANTQVFELLLNSGADVQVKNKRGLTPLFNAVTSGNVEVTHKLITLGSDVNSKNNQGETPLFYAAESENVKVAQLLIDQGANANAINNQGENALFKAAKGKNFEVVRLLIDKGSDLNIKNNQGETPLLSAANIITFNIAQLLVSGQADINAVNDRNETPLFSAVRGENFDVVKLFIDLGLDVNAKNEHGETPLFGAAKTGNAYIVQLLIEGGAMVDARDSQGRNALFSTIQNNNVDVVQLLVDNGADVNCLNNQNQWTPLHSVAHSGNFKVLKCLLKNGADVNALNSKGHSPLFTLLSESLFHSSVNQKLKLLLKYSSIDLIDGRGKDILSLAHRLDFWKVIVEHIAKLQALELPVEERLLDLILINPEYKGYYKQCTEELVALKSLKIKHCWLTYFDILTDKIKKIKNYAGNEDLMNDFRTYDWAKMFPIYGADMKENMEKGIERRKLFDKSAVILSNVLHIFNPTHLVIKDILECVTSTERSKLCHKNVKRSRDDM